MLSKANIYNIDNSTNNKNLRMKKNINLPSLLDQRNIENKKILSFPVHPPTQPNVNKNKAHCKQ